MTRSLKILLACEESQVVCREFRKLGHVAYSCDIQRSSGGFPQWHIMGDVRNILKDDVSFTTEDGNSHYVERWDAIIAFPPCTYLTSAGNRHYSTRCNTLERVEARKQLRKEARDFFMIFANCSYDHVAIENPVGYMNSHWRKPNQIIHPYYFGDNAMKRTCLWLKGLPILKYTDVLEKPKPIYITSKGKRINWCDAQSGKDQEERAKNRSKTFRGIAKAMATQWTEYLISNAN